MAIALFRRKLEGLLQGADILIDGDRPWDIHVQNPKLYARIWEHGTLGAGEAYMEGWWDCDQLDEMIARTLRAGMQKQLKPVFSLPTVVRARVSNCKGADAHSRSDAIPSHLFRGHVRARRGQEL
jgi:cyclopropane-fatty-acyl-phospholipid synthase